MIKKLLIPKVIAITIGVLVVILGFYWFQIRPSQIRKACHNETLGQYETNLREYFAKPHTNNNWAEGKVWTNWGATTNAGDGGIWGWWYPTPLSRSSVEGSYTSCLISKGIK